MIKRLLVLTFLLVITIGARAQADSLGIERRGDQVLVLHKVKSGQTLYSLSRRYGTSVQSIRDENGGLTTGLKVGQTLKIPYGLEVKVPAPTVAVPEDARVHTVAKGETLFSISRQYGLKVDELKTLNKLTSNDLALGQKLVVSKPVEVAATTQTTPPKPVTTTDNREVLGVAEEETTEPKDTLPANVSTNQEAVADTAVTSTAQEEVPEVTYDGTPFKEISEEGVAELIVEEDPSNKFLALHKTAKVGTVIKIRNLKNDLSVYVRVVGQIPETSDNANVLIKINKRAHDQLRALDPRFRVELSYFQ